MLYIGVDLGGTGIKAGLVDEQGKILSKVSCPTGVERGYEAVIRDMAALCVKAVEESGRSMDEVKAIGIGLPGIAYACAFGWCVMLCFEIPYYFYTCKKQQP